MNAKQALSNLSGDTVYGQQHSEDAEYGYAGLLLATFLQCAQQSHMNGMKHAINILEHFGVSFTNLW